MRNKQRLVLLASVLLAATVVHAEDNWSQWEPMGSTGISIRFAQPFRDMCTWAFRNDSNRRLKGMRFRIDDNNSKTGERESSNDLLPYGLNPGRAVGGWAAFSANATCSTVRITPTQIEWE